MREFNKRDLRLMDMAVERWALIEDSPTRYYGTSCALCADMPYCDVRDKPADLRCPIAVITGVPTCHGTSYYLARASIKAVSLGSQSEKAQMERDRWVNIMAAEMRILRDVARRSVDPHVGGRLTEYTEEHL